MEVQRYLSTRKVGADECAFAFRFVPKSIVRSQESGSRVLTWLASRRLSSDQPASLSEVITMNALLRFSAKLDPSHLRDDQDKQNI